MATSAWGIVDTGPASEKADTPAKLDVPTHPVVTKDPASSASAKVAFTISEACKYSSLSRSFIYSLFEQKRLPRLKAGKRVLILRRDIDDYLLSLREISQHDT